MATTLRRLLPALAVSLVALAMSGSASAATIDMVGKNERKLAFEGPKEVKKGSKLKVVNSTKPQAVGPHTFSLAKLKNLPQSEEEYDACFAPGGLCDQIFVAHEVDPETFEVAKPVVESGKKGWDTLFTAKKDGDSWYTETEGEKTSRKVRAAPGTKLQYFCLVHPWMTGKTKVVK